MGAQWSEYDVGTFQRLKERAGWLREWRGPRLRPPDPPTFECSTSSLVKRSGAVSEASAKGGRRARVGRCVQNSEEFSEEKIFPKFSAHQDFRRPRHIFLITTTPPNQPAQTAYEVNWGGGMGGRISDEIMRQKIFCVACEATSFFSKR